MSRRAVPWGIADVAVVVLFVAIGRRSHDESAAVLGFLTTLWPFLAGLAVGWLVTRAWRAPLGVVSPGVVLVVVTTGLGLGLRAISGQGVQLSFAIVALLVLAIGLLGWRIVVRLLRRRRRSRTR